MNEIAIIGKGNVGTHLFRAMSNSGINTSLYHARNFTGFRSEPDIILLTVRDDAVESMASSVASLLPDFNGIVAHTSGSLSIKALQQFFKNFGVFYPLQTFSKDNRALDCSEIPFFIEGSSPDVAIRLRSIAEAVSGKVYNLDSSQRMKMHIASVFACNFTNALYDVSAQILEQAEIPFSVMLPLIRQTVAKMETMLPHDAQTGPSVRGDKKIVRSHIDALASQPDIQEIYSMLSRFINPDI